MSDSKNDIHKFLLELCNKQLRHIIIPEYPKYPELYEELKIQYAKDFMNDNP